MAIRETNPLNANKYAGLVGIAAKPRILRTFQRHRLNFTP